MPKLQKGFHIAEYWKRKIILIVFPGAGHIIRAIKNQIVFAG
jgi:hypothetical protein